MRDKKRKKLEKRLREIEYNLSYYESWNLPHGKNFDNLIKARDSLRKKLGA